MGKSAGSAPTPVDPNVTIPLQAKYNQQAFDSSLAASRVNQVSPTGQTSWSKAPGTFDQTGWDTAFADWDKRYRALGQGGDSVDANGIPINTSLDYNALLGKAPNEADFRGQDTWTQTTALSPEQQKIFDANQSSQLGQSQLLDALTQRLGTSIQDPADFSKAPELTGSVNSASGKLDALSGKMGALDPKAFNQEASDAIYNQSTRYLDPQVQQEQKALEARLSEQGFVPGTPGYQQAMQNFQDTNNRAYADARDRATTAGTTVGHTQFGDSLGSIQAQIAAALSGQQADTNAGTFGNNARTQSIAEMLQQRSQPLNELNALRSGTQISVPGIGNGQASAPNLSSPDVLGAYNSQYQGQANAYNSATGSDNALMSGLFGLGGAALGGPMGAALGTALSNYFKKP